MAGCIILWGIIFVGSYLYRKEKAPEVISGKEGKYIIIILIAANMIATVLFLISLLGQESGNEIVRNAYGEGSKSESFHVTVEGELENEPFTVTVGEQEYTYDDTLKMFEEMLLLLDETILGENESFDKVEHDLNLVSQLKDYPAQIRWEMDRYNVIDTEGNILEDYDIEEGTLLEIRGTIQYAGETAIYTAHAMIFPEVKSSKEKIVDAISKMIQQEEADTREESVFLLPSSIDGKELHWEKERDLTGYYVLLLGGVIAVWIPVKKVQDEKERKKIREKQMLLDYPEIISKFTLLLGTGMTMKAVWTKIVQTYEEDKLLTGKREAYEEMCVAYREMQGGIPEKEAYERFGKRCGIVPYMKLGALLSQNLRKGSKGLTELLSMESIQAFEERKNRAKKYGEEASTKLMIPMFLMLAIVLVMVIVPAFLSMQI